MTDRATTERAEDMVESLRLAGELAISIGQRLLRERDEAKAEAERYREAIFSLLDALDEIVRVRDDPTQRWLQATIRGTRASLGQAVD